MRRFWFVVALAVATMVGCNADAPTQNPDDEEVQLSPEVIAQMEALLAEKAARTPAQRKISSSLLYTRSGRFDASIAAFNQDPARQVTSLQQRDARGRVLVDVIGDMAKLGNTVEALGGNAVDTQPRSQRAWMPLDQLEALAADPAVRLIHPAFQARTARTDKPGAGEKFRSGTREERIAAVQAAIAALAENPPNYPTFDPERGRVNVGIAQTQGDRAHAAEHARNFFNVDGTGVRIGVLSDSIDFLPNSVASGDLPPNVTVVQNIPGSGEGTAMLEIVHDVAPGAQLFFATAFVSAQSFAANIRALRAPPHNCDIIIDDVLYFAESPYVDDIIAQAVNDVTASGALYFSAAGNEANLNDGSSGHWEGDFRPSGALATLPSGYTVHSYGSGVISNRIELTGGPLILQWSDFSTMDIPVSSNDYDLFVLDHNLRNVVLASTDIQAGADLPFEFLGFIIPDGFRVVIAAKPGAETRAVRTLLFNGELGLSTPGATYGHNSTVNGFGVGAVEAAEAGPSGEFVAGPTTPLELFSSDGPRRIFFRPDGGPINADRPGATFASGGGNTRAKPDIAAADGVSTSLPPGSGLNPFFGTSAAAPHAGAIAGLIKSALPSRTAAQIRSAILSSALDIEATGADRDSGSGIISAFAGLQRAGAVGRVNLRRGEVLVRPLGTDVVLPGGAALVSVGIDNVGGAAATGVTATLSSSSPDVLILQGTSTYPTIGAETAGTTNTTLFAFFVSPTAPCGAVLPFAVTVNFTGGTPVVFTFTAQLGRPSTTPTNFPYGGPPVPIPDANAAGVNVNLPVNFEGPVTGVQFKIDGTVCNANIGSTTVGLNHTWVGDLVGRLTSPGVGGRTVTLFSRPGGNGNSGNNFCQTFFADSAATSIQNILIAQAPFTGTFRPSQPLAPFAGVNPNGNWIFHVHDEAGADIGSVRAFSLDVAGFSCTP